MTGDVIQYAKHRRSGNPRARYHEPLLVAEIVDALCFLGGAAHRDQVFARVASVRADQMAIATPALREELQQAFDSHRQAFPGGLGPPPLLDLPFGGDSRRWALTRAAADLLSGIPPSFQMAEAS